MTITKFVFSKKEWSKILLNHIKNTEKIDLFNKPADEVLKLLDKVIFEIECNYEFNSKSKQYQLTIGKNGFFVRIWDKDTQSITKKDLYIKPTDELAQL